MTGSNTASPRRRGRPRGSRETHPPPSWPGDPASVTPDGVDFEAVAHVLANTCRHGGRLRTYHSVAAHALLMSEEVAALAGLGDEERRVLSLHALLRDARIAWLGGRGSDSLRAAERARRLAVAIDAAVREAAGLEAPTAEQADVLNFTERMAEAAEQRDLGASGPRTMYPPLARRIRTFDPERAAALWLARLRELTAPASAGNAAVGRAGGAPGVSATAGTSP